MPRAVDPGVKRPTNLSVRGTLLDAARDAGLNLSALLEAAIVRELAGVRRRRWEEENFHAISGYNEQVARQGLPFRRRTDG